MELPTINLDAFLISKERIWKHYDLSVCFNENNEIIDIKISKKESKENNKEESKNEVEDSQKQEDEVKENEPSEVKEDNKPERKLKERVCKKCKKLFNPDHSRRVYCNECIKQREEERASKRITRICEKCNKEFSTPIKRQRRLCSECSGEKRKRSKLNEEKIIGEESICPICLQLKPTYNNTCGAYKCISSWNKCSSEEIKALRLKAKEYAEKINSSPELKRKYLKKVDGIGCGKQIKVF